VVQQIINNSDSVIAFSDSEHVEVIEAVRNKCPTLKHIVIFDEVKGDQISFEDFIKGTSDELECVDTKCDDVAYIIYTSGTTGLPKGVVRTHKDPYAVGIPASRILALKPDDIFMHPQEMSFEYVMLTLDAVIITGAQMVLYSGRTVPEKVLEYIEKYKVTKFAGVPSLYRMILSIEDFERKYDLSFLKIVISAGEPLPASTYENIKKHLGIECYDVLGQTECCMICGERPTFFVKPGSMGKPYPGLPIAIIDDDGNFCPPNKVGRLVIKDNNPALLKEFRKMPKKWAETHKYPGWYDTGDLAYADEDGYFFHAGRSDDMIKSRAYLVGPREIEETIIELPEILEAAVVGTPDPVMENRIKTFVTLKPDYKPTKELAEKIREHVKGRIAPYKIPKDIEFVGELPKSPTGKILRRELRKLEEERCNKGVVGGFRF
jgi:acyl-coenzyme A synthetase/AMP-(fatty) acid ligase